MPQQSQIFTAAPPERPWHSGFLFNLLEQEGRKVMNAGLTEECLIPAQFTTKSIN